MQVAIEGEWRRREEEKDNPSNTREDLDLGTKEKETNKNGKTSDTDENCSESEGMSQPTGLISVDMSLGGGHSHAMRMLCSPGGVHVVREKWAGKKNCSCTATEYNI